MTKRLTDEAPKQLGGQSLTEVQTLDGVKYLFADDFWLLVCPPALNPFLGSMPKAVRKKW